MQYYHGQVTMKLKINGWVIVHGFEHDIAIIPKTSRKIIIPHSDDYLPDEIIRNISDMSGISF